MGAMAKMVEMDHLDQMARMPHLPTGLTPHMAFIVPRVLQLAEVLLADLAPRARLAHPETQAFLPVVPFLALLALRDNLDLLDVPANLAEREESAVLV